LILNIAFKIGVTMCKLVLALEATSIFVSTISITAIALDRYQVILHSGGQNNALSSILKLVSIWITAIMLALPLFLFRTVETHKLGKYNSFIQINIFSKMISLLIVFEIEISHRHTMAWISQLLCRALANTSRTWLLFSILNGFPIRIANHNSVRRIHALVYEIENTCYSSHVHNSITKTEE
jgi:hypothetical protein